MCSRVLITMLLEYPISPSLHSMLTVEDFLPSMLMLKLMMMLYMMTMTMMVLLGMASDPAITLAPPPTGKTFHPVHHSILAPLIINWPKNGKIFFISVSVHLK